MTERRDVPIETDALGAIRLELIGAARRRAAARRRRRQMVATVATGLTMLVAVTGVSAVSGFSTGVPVIDNVLSQEHGEQRAAPLKEDIPAGPPGTDVRPAPGSTSDALDLRWPDGSAGAKGLAYLSMGGDVCFVRAGKPGRGGANEARGRTGCLAPQLIAERLSDQWAFVAGVIVGNPTIVSGYAASDVEAIEITGPGGPLDVQLTRLWTPNTLDAETMRVFAATADVDLGEDGISPEASSEMMDFRNYSIGVRLQDGRTVEVGDGGF